MTMTATSVILYSWAVFALVWLIGALRTKQTLRTTPAVERAIVLPILLLGFFLALSNWFPSGLAIRALPPSAGMRAIGAALTLLGCLFAIWARLALGTNWSGRPTVKTGHELITTGPYAWARHPIYTGILAAAIGTALADLQWRRVLGVAVIAAAIALKMRTEEKLMMQTFPDAYPPYRKRVKALIPGLF
jgi:protein-S-isoprenylcysteine O-methyltransferase Ste14